MISASDCLLLAHAGTLFPVFAGDVRKADLLPFDQVAVGLIRHELGKEDLPPDTLGELDPDSVRLATTASRSVLGYMNEIARYCEYAIDRCGGNFTCRAGRLATLCRSTW